MDRFAYGKRKTQHCAQGHLLIPSDFVHFFFDFIPFSAVAVAQASQSRYIENDTKMFAGRTYGTRSMFIACIDCARQQFSRQFIGKW